MSSQSSYEQGDGRERGQLRAKLRRMSPDQLQELAGVISDRGLNKAHELVETDFEK